MASGSTRTLFITPAYLIQNASIDANVEAKELTKAIRVAEDKYIMPIIGSPLYEALIDKINTNTLTAGAYKTLMDNYIIPCLIEYAYLQYLQDAGTIKTTNKGMQRPTSPDSQLPEPNVVYNKLQAVRETAQFYGERLIKHLKANIQSFPEYYRYTSIEDVKPARGEYFSGIQFPGMNRGNCGLDGMGITTNIDF